MLSHIIWNWRLDLINICLKLVEELFIDKVNFDLFFKDDDRFFKIVKNELILVLLSDPFGYITDYRKVDVFLLPDNQ